MHPAFSVIFFSTLTGLGYGTLFWTAAGTLRHNASWAAESILLTAGHLFLLALSFGLVSIGLLSSLGHLGRPLRAWRALSQWRTSWLSREGISAIATFVPLLWLADIISGWVTHSADPGFPTGLGLPGLVAATACIVGALATVTCTAMIYASLKPVPAWRHRVVVPGYLLFALQGGLLCFATISAFDPDHPVSWSPLALFGALALAALKLAYWRDIDRGILPASRPSALGLAADRVATVFERPHTEASYLTKEMGFVVARKHSRKLRWIAISLFAAVPALACAVAVLLPPLELPAMAIALFSTTIGTLVERWLFFAEAKHLVTLYY